MVLGRRTAVVVVVAMLCSGCWAQYKGDASRSGYQQFETRIALTNVATLTEGWTATTGGFIDRASPVIYNGTAYVTSFGTNLYAFDANGQRYCANSPKSCAPMWVGVMGPQASSLSDATPAVANGIVYVESIAGELFAFDAAGVRNCSSAYRTCAPLWKGSRSALLTLRSAPLVADGRVYVTSFGTSSSYIEAFDAAGQTNCTGPPSDRSCQPVWVASVSGISSSPSLANGVLYVGTGGSYTATDNKLWGVCRGFG